VPPNIGPCEKFLIDPQRAGLHNRGLFARDRIVPALPPAVRALPDSGPDDDADDDADDPEQGGERGSGHGILGGRGARR
jgi:hypothetical protein